MGVGGAGNRSLGLAAVTRLRPAAMPELAPPTRVVLLLFGMTLLSGCKAVPEIAGVVAGGTAGAATANPAVGFLVGVATDAATEAGLRYYGRTRQGAEQDAIAQVAGDLPVGAEAAWKIEHTIPFDNEHGRLRVVRTIDSPLAACKEIAFSVDEGRDRTLRQAWYVTSICKAAETWKWAAAEPAVERWGFLQ